MLISKSTLAITSPEPLESLIKKYLSASNLRPEVLFQTFLPIGYRHTTISSVAPELFDSVLLAKIHLGMIITLYDDLADHPTYRNTKLLKELYRLNIAQDHTAPENLKPDETKTYELARYLFSNLTSLIETFDHASALRPALQFDIEQFYTCNRHSELMSALPAVRNIVETKNLGPYNMGMVAAGTIDLMASPSLNFMELGRCRELFILGQRMGRISNLIFTYKREQDEGDQTNEILISNIENNNENYRQCLLSEFSDILAAIRSINLFSFSADSYADGLIGLHQLHASLEGRI